MGEGMFYTYGVIPKSLPSQWKPALCWLLKAQVSSVQYAYCCDFFFVIAIKKSPFPQRKIHCIFCIIMSTDIALSSASVTICENCV